MKNLYTAHATSVGGRSGHVETDDKRLAFDLTPSTSKTGTNPEQLFACGWSACFGSAVDAVVKKEKLDAGTITVKVDVELNQDDSGYSLAATINLSLEKLAGAEAEKVIHAAHQMCPYSKATRGNIPVTLKVNDQSLVKAA